ncbi:MAG: DUF6600 domain-containing protein [Chthoniobacteraceae bacterium]
MTTKYFFLLTAAFALFAGCDRASQSAEAQRLAAERAALEQDKSALAAERAEADRQANEQERARLDSERATLELEKARVSGDKESVAEAQRQADLAAEREKRMAAERRAAEDSAARRAAEAREEQVRQAVQGSAIQTGGEQTTDSFYDALDPYGDWVQTDRYGYVFRPRTTGSGWRPYTDGSWVRSEYGWTWRSNEPFGWATYHYGRWAQLPRTGWVWVPGSEWGPAWVSWRKSDDYVGWAPLPPDAWSANGFTAAVDSYFDIGPGLYAFLRVGDFGEPSYVGRVVEPSQNVAIINQTVNVTNVTYKKVKNVNTIVNEGPDIAVINKRSRNAVKRVNVNRVAIGGVKGGKGSKMEGDTLTLEAPAIKNDKPVRKPKRVKEEVKVAEVERGWREAKGDDAVKFRAANKAKAREIEDAQRHGAPNVNASIPTVPTAPPLGAVPGQVETKLPADGAAEMPEENPRRDPAEARKKVLEEKNRNERERLTDALPPEKKGKRDIQMARPDGSEPSEKQNQKERKAVKAAAEAAAVDEHKAAKKENRLEAEAATKTEKQARKAAKAAAASDEAGGANDEEKAAKKNKKKDKAGQ